MTRFLLVLSLFAIQSFGQVLSGKWNVAIAGNAGAHTIEFKTDESGDIFAKFDSLPFSKLHFSDNDFIFVVDEQTFSGTFSKSGDPTSIKGKSKFKLVRNLARQSFEWTITSKSE